MNQETTNMHDAHCDPEELALAALGERTDIDTEHLASCDTCQADLASLRRVVRITRSGTEEHISSPAPSVWQAVNAEMRTTVNIDAGSTDDGVAVVVPMRRRTAPWLAAAAAVGVIVGAIGATLWTQGVTSPSTVVAQTALEPLDGYSSTGVARVESTSTGDVVSVNVRNLPPTEGYYEVWLLTEDGSAMVSLGAVGSGETSTLPLPPGIALERFRIVDISAEEFDGDPTHSTISIARGDLQA
jgi:hypothetical protein